MSFEAKDIDWPNVEADYRAGIKSNVTIANEYFVTEGAIRKRAKKENWVKDLSIRPSKKVLLAPEVDAFDKAGFVYVIYIDAPDKPLYKIGMAKHFNSRFDQHQCASPYDIGVACVYFVGNMRHEERSLHGIFKSKHIRGEWFELNNDDLINISLRSKLI